MTRKSAPFALVVRKGTFAPYNLKHTYTPLDYELSREEAIKIIVAQLGIQDIVVSTTGKISRELFEYRVVNNQSNKNDFYNIGAMGCAQ